MSNLDLDKPVLQVAAKAAIVNDEGKVLIVREAPTGEDNTKVGYWGLVGGRLEPGESFAEGLAREVREETDLTVEAIGPLHVGEWRPVIRGVPHQIIAIFMLCRPVEGSVAMNGEHDEYLWISPAERTQYPMKEPDCFVVDALSS